MGAASSTSTKSLVNLSDSAIVTSLHALRKSSETPPLDPLQGSTNSSNYSPVIERGITLVETLVAMMLAMLIGGAMVANLQFSLRMSKYTEIHHAASNIASNRMEQMAAVDVLDLGSSYNESNVTVPWASIPGITFKRSTTVTVNADSSRTALVTVTVLGYDLPVNVSYQNRYTIW